ncbi:Transcriptional regulator, Xre-family with cupin domain [hydrothermal vent metagenome]|uniref:Transcriptional regulator, Xre-family with cupin domain n=1 Tax=hydrothermal vent metagenome TaxID=652676 RepID=A0A3B1DUZ2_9ZZZZ
MATKRKKRVAPAVAGSDKDDISGQLCRRVRQLRKERGWSLEELSAACHVSRSMLSQIERDQANPTLAVTARIAQAFGMSIGELVETPGASSAIDVIRASDRKFHYRSDDDCCIRTLSPLHLEKDVEFYEVQLQPKGVLRSAPHFEGTREFLTVQKGKVRIESADETAELSKGDSVSYRADVSHAIINLSKGESLLFLVDIYAP